jgi:hypothetical protein
MNSQQMRRAWIKAAGHATTEDLMNERALDVALKKKFGRTGPRGALRAMGFDSNEIDDVLEDTNMRTLHPRRPGDTRRIRGLDDNPLTTAEEAMALIEELCEDLPEPEQAELEDMLEERLLSDAPNTSEDRRRRRAEDARAGRRRRSRLGRDEPEPFPGRPNTGGGQDPLDARAQDRVATRRQLHGMDAAGLPAFEDLFPSVAKRNRNADRDLGILPSLNL